MAWLETETTSKLLAALPHFHIKASSEGILCWGEHYLESL